MQVQAVREGRPFESYDLNRALENVREYWKDLETRPAVTIDNRIQACLNQEHRSVWKLYNFLVQTALQRPSNYDLYDWTSRTVVQMDFKEPGGRRWAQREMGVGAALAVRTAVLAMRTLVKKGLIEIEVHEGVCTFIRVLGLVQYFGEQFWRVSASWLFQKKKRKAENPSLPTGVSVGDTFPPPDASS